MRAHGVSLAERQERQIPHRVPPDVGGIALEHHLGDLGYLTRPSLIAGVDLHFAQRQHGKSMESAGNEVGFVEGEAALKSNGGLRKVAHLQILSPPRRL